MTARRSGSPAPLARIHRLRDALPSGYCKGLCVGSCHGPVEMSDAEHDHLLSLGVDIPMRATDPERFRAALDDPEYWCPALDRESGRCAQYESRPIMCSTWGGSDLHPCPHGCTPDGGRISARRALRVFLESLKLGGSTRAGIPRSWWRSGLDSLDRGDPVPADMLAHTRKLAAKVAGSLAVKP